uniref:Uncharacterized protein n=1 Tax=Physcomitrium patens TaxID=3218 RepID=A0A7I4CGU2_PHYPA
MASMQRLDTVNLSSPDGGPHGVGGGAHRGFGASLDKSHSFRDGHEGRASGGGGPSSSHGEAPALASVLFLESISLPSVKSNAQTELRRAMNAASSQQGDDPSLGGLQSKALESCSGEEIKRMRVGLTEGASRARERMRHLSEAVIKLDRFLYAMQSRKRSRPESGGHDKGGHAGGGQRGASSGHVAKGGGRSASSSGEISRMVKGGGEKSKSGMINKRMRTSLADARPEGRPSNLSVQRSSGVQERERGSPRPSSFLSSPVEEKERVGGGGGGSYEKTKMKGRRSATIKAEAAVVSVANGGTDVEREQKGSVQHHRGGVDGRARPSEGHGYRSAPSGPVHGTLSVQKAEAIVHANGGGMRGGGKGEADGSVHGAGRVERSIVAERERANVKGGATAVGREEARVAGPGMMPKAKRSNLVSGSNQSGHASRASSFADVREKPAALANPAKEQAASGPVNRKRPAPSRSSSPPVASWGSSRPQTMARARRVNLNPPVSISVPEKEEENGGVDAGGGARDGGVSSGTPGARSTSSGAGGVLSLTKRAVGGQLVGPSKAQAERGPVSLGSEESVEEVAKSRERSRKGEEEDGERKGSGGREKSGSVVATMKKEAALAAEESGGGDGVRRQGRTGRGSVAPRVAAASTPVEKVEVSAGNAKPMRSGRAAVETKLGGGGRPGTKKGSGDRKASSRPRRVLGNSGGEMTEEEDDHEQLSRAVQQAVELSASACPNSFWREVEPYFAYVTSDDLSFLQRRIAMAGECNSSWQGQSLDALVEAAGGGDRGLGGGDAKEAKQSKEQGAEERKLRRGRGGGWYDKVFPLSQRLLSALICEREDGESERVGEEGVVELDSDSPRAPSTQREMDCERRDAEGESDVDNAKADSEWWSAGARAGGYSEGSPMSDGEDIVVGSDGHGAAGADWGSGGDDEDNEAGCGRQAENGWMDWEEQYGRMSLDDRLAVELRSIGLEPAQVAEQEEAEEDDMGDELRGLQIELAEQVSRNKERLCRLESAVMRSRAGEERAREKLAMDKLVELAYRKKTGGRSSKGGGVKGARAVALAFAKRVLTRVHNFEGGVSCITDPALRERLLCVAPSGAEGTVDGGMDASKDGGGGAGSGGRMASPRGAEAERGSLDGQSHGVNFWQQKEGVWTGRAREREAFLEDGSGYACTRDVNTLSLNGLGGIKGKRSERERDGKVKEGGAGGRSGHSNVKGERKTKTKPRQKTGPLLKSVHGLVAKAAEQQPGKGRLLNEGRAGATERQAMRSEEVMPSLGALQEAVVEGDGQIDLSAIPLPGMEEMSMGQADMGSWLDFDLEDPLQQTDDFLMGLDVPMDDLSGLQMMM